MDIANIILEAFTTDEVFTRTAIPYIKEEYFEEEYQRLTFRVIDNFVLKYNTLPNKDVILVDVEKEKGLTDSLYEQVSALCDSWSGVKHTTKWLLEEGEKWCQERALYIAIRRAALSLDTSKKADRGKLPEILSEALSVGFDHSVGLNFFPDLEKKFEAYTHKDSRLAFDLTLLNEMTDNGVPRKTLNVIMGGPHTGKTRTMCHLAAAYASLGYNVVYFTMEMSEIQIAKRIDANLLNVKMDHFETLSKEKYTKLVEKLRSHVSGNIVIKEYPTAGAHAGHFRHTLKELERKKNFIPDVIMVDYMNICASSRLPPSKSGETYNYVGSIAAELRGLAIEFNTVLWTGTQTRRSAWSASDLEMDDVSESAAVLAICDFCIGLITDDHLQTLNQVKIKNLKNRYADLEKNKSGHLNYSNEYMRLTDAPKSSHYAPAPSMPSQAPGRTKHVDTSGFEF